MEDSQSTCCLLEIISLSAAVIAVDGDGTKHNLIELIMNHSGVFPGLQCVRNDGAIYGLIQDSYLLSISNSL